ncbi:MAG: type III pantothenate kinase [Deltaproteobacteria bacterium]|nr:type III pantothenate kinase [Deltaproteobacteria bacterium]
MSKMLLLDIGNTNIKIGLANADGLLRSFSLPSSRDETADSLGLNLAALLTQAKVAPRELTAALASSVVPNLNPLLRRACADYLGLELLFVPEDIPIPLENRYAEPSQVGADRLVGAFAARRLFPEPASIICVDYGTATTFDCVQENAYLGGLICPGVLSAASALSSRTAKLPVVSLEVEGDGPYPGRSTSTSISHGFVFGFAAMTEGLCLRLSRQMKAPCFVLGTGGFALPLSRVTGCFDAVRADLLLEGLRLIQAERHK